MNDPIPAFLEESPIYRAVIQGEIDDVRASLEDRVFSWDWADDDEDDYIFKESLRKAIESDRRDILEVMMQASFGHNEYDRGTWKPWYVADALETAARLGKEEIVTQILATERDNIHAISNALDNGVWSHNLHILQMLLDAGASPNARTEYGTPLIAAAQAGDLKIVKFLIEAGADPNKWVDMDGYFSPLLTAASEGHKDIFDYLLPLIINGDEIDVAREYPAMKIKNIA
jgi:Ankyrin repeats (3 copies)